MARPTTSDLVPADRLLAKGRGASPRADEAAFTDSAELYVEKDSVKEDAVKHKRVWVRMTRLCNQRCTFCLDSWNQDGSYVPTAELMDLVRRGREKGGERLILSGGEATVHPDYLKLVRYGKKLGYDWVQTVTNGQMFAYPEFALKAKLAGLDEATFSMHGHTPRLHDRLVGLPGAFERGNQAIRNLQALGGVVVNVDVVINKLNVAHLRAILDFYMAMGIREFDLLYIVPFGRGFDDYRSQLFFDIEAHQEDLQRAFELSREPGVFIWTNRLPAPQLEGYEHLIQDPHKLHVEVNGGRDNFEGFMRTGTMPDCHGERCDYCFLAGLCRDTMPAYRERHVGGTFERVRVDLTVTVPAASPEAARALARQRPSVVEVVAPSTEVLRAYARDHVPPGATLVAELPESELGDLIAEPGPVTALLVASPRALELLAAADLPDSLGVEVALDREVAAWLEERPPGRLEGRLTLRLPSREYLSESRDRDPTPATLRRLADLGYPTRGVPPCIAGERSLPAPHLTLDGAMIDARGDLDIDAYVHHYVTTEYLSKSKRCRACIHDGACRGMHINYLRNHGFEILEPVRGD